MYLQRLSLIDFKNVGEAQIELSPQINCMVGDNGTGKTNLLDAVHYLSMCKSAFGLSDTQCVRHGSEAFLVDGRYGEPATDRTERIVCSFKKGGQKKLCRNGKEYEKLSDHIGLIPLVLVTPSDTALINESGEERRKYLNSFISQLDREYLSALVRYNRLLAERNKLLKRQQSPGFEELIEVFDAQLCPLAATLWQKRKELVSELAPVVAGYYAALSGDRERVGLGYRAELNERPMARILRETNDRLSAQNLRIADANRIKEVYIGGFLQTISEYINKLSGTYQYVNKMLRDDRIAELRRECARSNIRNDELKEFYALFDKTFLGLFPSFIDEMNGLLADEARTEGRHDGELTTVLRIYALIRLGITDTATIAALLHCSIRTVYNYRSFTQRHSRPDVGDLEQRVQLIGLNGIAARS